MDENMSSGPLAFFVLPRTTPKGKKHQMKTAGEVPSLAHTRPLGERNQRRLLKGFVFPANGQFKPVIETQWEF